MSESNAYCIWLTGEELEALERKLKNNPEKHDEEHLEFVQQKLDRAKKYAYYDDNA